MVSIETPTGEDVLAWRKAIWVANVSADVQEARERCVGHLHCGDGFLAVWSVMRRVERITGWSFCSDGG